MAAAIEPRSQEELAGGFLRCRIGSTTRNMSTLKVRGERDWKLLLAERIETIGNTDVGDADFSDFGNPGTLKALAPMANMPTDLMVDLVVAYDQGGALGGRDFIEDNADSEQLYVILRRIVNVVFPFITDVRSAIVDLATTRRLTAIARSNESPSTNGAEPTGLAPTLNGTSTQTN